MNLNQEQIKRYTRHILLPEIGVEGQKKLLAAKVLVVGAGGLGCPISLYLAAAGVGTIGLVDFDTIDASNLQRQILFTTEDIGKSKVEVAAKRLKALNPDVVVNTYAVALKSDNIMEILKNYDMIIDGTDNFPTRYLTNDAAALQDKPNIYGSIFRFVYAFELARSRRRRLASITKSNASPHHFVMWDEIVDQVHRDYPDVHLDRILVDAAAAYMISAPDRFDVVVASNLFGDILTDIGAVIQGGMGMAASANITPDRSKPGMLEPVHGSAPDITGNRPGQPGRRGLGRRDDARPSGRIGRKQRGAEGGRRGIGHYQDQDARPGRHRNDERSGPGIATRTWAASTPG